LLAGKDQTLLIWRNAFLVLDLGLDVVNGVGRLDLECDGCATLALLRKIKGKRTRKGELTLASEGLDEDLHDASYCEVKETMDSKYCSVSGDGNQAMNVMAVSVWQACFYGARGEARQEFARTRKLVS
jgi:hypothetical protein